MKIPRCVNYDWLEVYALEDVNFPARTLSYYQSYYGATNVVPREYGTPMYKEMFTICSGRTKIFEVRRDVLSKRSEGGIFPDNCCHIRLCNRSCYFPDPVGLLIDIMKAHHLTYISTKRVDICLDFNHFDNGDNPASFLRKYHARKYAKFYQREFAGHGQDNWQDCYYNSIKWGSASSVLTTKLYNKTEEMSAVTHDKPYIREAWKNCGLDLNQDVWRVEFSIRPELRNLIRETDGKQLPVDIMQFRTRPQILNLFFMLADRYFRFCYVEKKPDGTLQRKDRCRQKILFKVGRDEIGYKPENEPTRKLPADKNLVRLVQRLVDLADEVHTAAEVDHLYYTARFIIDNFDGMDVYRQWAEGVLQTQLPSKYIGKPQ